MSETAVGSATGRREPPGFRHLEVLYTEQLGPRMIRVTFGGSDLAGLSIVEPAASVRLLLPSPGARDLVMPSWNGNEFLLPDGTRPVIRTFTPRNLDLDTPSLDLDMVVHEGGIASRWAQAASPGSQAALSGPGRGYRIEQEAPEYVLAGDETAIPAIGQLLEGIPPNVRIQVHIEVSSDLARIALPEHEGAAVTWHESIEGRPSGDALVAAIRSAEFHTGARVWCAGEAASMHRIRSHLFKERELPRAQATVRGYWKVARKPASS